MTRPTLLRGRDTRTSTRKQRDEFIALLRANAPRLKDVDLDAIAKRLMRYGTTYGYIQELWCNGPCVDNGVSIDEYRRVHDIYNQYTRPYYERKEARIESKVRALAHEIGCGVRFGSDPRGHTIKLVLPNGFYNDMGQEGLCVPTS